MSDGGRAGLDRGRVARCKHSSDAVELESEDTEEESHLQDHGYAFVVMLSGFILNLLVGGFVKGFGFIYNEIIARHPEASATEVSTILATLVGARGLLCPLAGALTVLVGARVVVICGGLLCTLGLLLSSLRVSLTTLVFTLGGLVGIGLSLIEIIGVIVISQYFVKWRSTANGLRAAGNPLGGVLLSPVVALLIENFGFRLTMVWLAAMMLQICVCGALMRPFSVHEKIMKINNRQVTLRGTDLRSTSTSCRKVPLQTLHECPDKMSSRSLQLEIGNNRYSYVTAPGEENTSSCRTKSSDFFNEVNKESKETYDCLAKHQNKTDSVLRKSSSSESKIDICGTLLERRYSTGIIPTKPKEYSELITNKLDQSTDIERRSCVETDKTIDILDKGSSANSRKGHKITSGFDFKLFLNPNYATFLVSVILAAISFPNTQYYIAVYGHTLGLSPTQSSIVMSVQSLVDFLCRIFCGWINDRNIFKRTHGFIASLVLAGVGCLVVPFTWNFSSFSCALLLWSLGLGYYWTIIGVILADQFGSEALPTSWGFVKMTHGIFSFIYQPLIGLLVDAGAGYAGALGLMGCCLLLSAVVMAFQPYVAKLSGVPLNVS